MNKYFPDLKNLSLLTPKETGEIKFLPRLLFCWKAADLNIFSNVNESNGLLVLGDILEATKGVGCELDIECIVEEIAKESLKFISLRSFTFLSIPWSLL